MATHILRCLSGALVLGVLPGLSTGCTRAPQTIEVVPVAGAAEPVSNRGERYAKDVAAIAGAFASALQLPSIKVPIVLFPNRRAFEQGLIEIGYTPQLARTASAFDAIGGARAVLVNAQVVDAYDRGQRVRLLAHELVHSMQYGFGGGTRGDSEQWLREGFAEWVACRVADYLRLDRFDDLRDQVLSPLAAVPLGTAPAPLAGLSTFPQWTEAQRRSDGRLYAQAFLAAEVLVAEHGPPGLVRYFEHFKRGTDRRQAFSRAFGMDLQAFEAVLARRWHQAVAERQGR